MLGPRSGRIAAARKLLRPSGRRELGLVLLEGPSAVSAAVAAGVVRELYATASAARRHGELLASSGVDWQLISDEAATALSETVTPQGLVAVAPLPRASLADVLGAPARRPGPRFMAVLVEARDPGNAGTVIRTADAAGAHGIVLAGESVDPWSGKCVRASAGSILHLPIVQGVTPLDAITALRHAGWHVVAADGRADVDVHAPEVQQLLSGDHAWLFGNEAHGLPSSVRDSSDSSLRVPVYGQAESLNLAAAAAVCLYESARVTRPSQLLGGPREVAL